MADLTIRYQKICRVRRNLSSLVNKLTQVYSTDEVILECMTQRGYTSNEMYEILKSEGLFVASSLSDIKLLSDLSQEELEECGLVRDGNYILSGRFTLPIRDIVGEVVALVGWYPNTSRKYVTTPTYGFSKSATFYGIHHFAEHSSDCCFLVEGIFDTLSLLSLGYMALGNQGLELSAYKCEMLKRFAKVIAIPDGDAGGRSVNPFYHVVSRGKSKVWNIPVDTTFVDLSKSGVKDIDDYLKNEERTHEFKLKVSTNVTNVRKLIVL